MAQLIIGGRREVDALMYGPQHPGTQQFLETQLSQPSQILTDTGRQFFADLQVHYDYFHGAEAQRLAELAISKVKGLFQPNSIRSLWDLADLQQAPIAMQRWIMAEPTIRQAYHLQRLDGYSGTYEDLHPGQVGAQHHDWRMVNHGLVQIAPAQTGHDWEVSFFLDPLAEDDRELSLDEKVNIMSTWEAMKQHFLTGKDDPTSPVGGKL